MLKVCRDILPRLKAEASTVNTIAQANPRLILALVGRRCPDAQNVNCCVPVAVKHQITGITVKRSLSQFQFLQMPTTGAFPGRALKAPDLDDRLAALQSHPFQNVEKAAEPQIADFATPQSFHTREVEVFKVERVVAVAQSMCQLEMMLTALVGNISAVLGKYPLRSFVAMRSLNLTRQLTVERACFADILREELRIGVSSPFVVNEESFQPEIKSAAFTRAGFENDLFLNDAENEPQPADWIALDGERLDQSAYLTVLHKLVLRAVNRERIAVQLVARLRESERRILARPFELRTSFRQPLKEALVGIIHAPTHVLANLRVQVLPQHKRRALSQLQDVLVHVVQRDVFSGQAVVASLEGDEMIPDRRGDKQLVSQATILLVAAIEAVLVHFLDNHDDCPRMYCSMTAALTLPAVLQKYEWVHSEGSLSRCGNS